MQIEATDRRPVLIAVVAATFLILTAALKGFYTDHYTDEFWLFLMWAGFGASAGLALARKVRPALWAFGVGFVVLFLLLATA